MIFSWWIPRNGITGSYGSSVVSILRSVHTVPLVAVPIYIPTHSVGGFPFLHRLLAFIICRYFDGAILTCMRWFSSVTQLCLTFYNPLDCSMPGLPVHHQLLELTQTHVHSVGDAIQPSHPLSSPSPPAFNLSQHLGPFQWVSSAHQVARVLEFELPHQSFQWIFRTHFL